MEQENAYWQSNIRLILTCLVIWFVVSFGCGILFVEELNQFRLWIQAWFLVRTTRFYLYLRWFGFLVCRTDE